MPINTNTFNSRVTDENLERRFRETFKSQAGAELIQDLYAQGTIVPIVDFTNAATGSVLATDLQQAWDKATTNTVKNTSGNTTLVSTAGFYKVTVNAAVAAAENVNIFLFDGSSAATVWAYTGITGGNVALQDTFVVLVPSDYDLLCNMTLGNSVLSIQTRQIADLYGNLTDPSGFVSQ
jgi:hypothetical protein